MELIKSFQDLQNETCEIWQDEFGNYWIGRRSMGSKMNLSFEMTEQIFKLAEYENKKTLDHKNERKHYKKNSM